MNALTSILLVAAGGATGAALRHLISIATHHTLGHTTWPWATLLINWIGCLAIGLVVAGVIERTSNPMALRLLLITGVLGGFTTYSAFAIETVTLLEERRYLLAALYVVLTNVGCLALTWLGVRAVRLG
jgi:CrcB protein